MLRIFSLFLLVCILAMVIFLPYALGRLSIEFFPDFFEIVSPEAPFLVIWIIGLGKLVVCLALYSLWRNIYNAVYEQLKEKCG